MEESKLTARGEHGMTLSTVLGVSWIQLLGAAVAFYMVYFSTYFSFGVQLALGTIAFILAPLLTVIPTDLILRYQAGQLAKKNGAPYGGVKDRSKLGLLSNGKMVIFTPERIQKFKGYDSQHITGHIQTMPVTKEFESLHKKVQSHLEWSGLLFSSRRLFTILFLVVNHILLSTTSLSERVDWYHPPFAVVMTAWFLTVMITRTFLFESFMMKGQLVFYLQENRFENTDFAMFDDEDLAICDRFLEQNGFSSHPVAVMLDGSMVFEVSRNKKTIEYMLINRH